MPTADRSRAAIISMDGASPYWTLRGGSCHRDSRIPDCLAVAVISPALRSTVRVALQRSVTEGGENVQMPEILGPPPRRIFAPTTLWSSRCAEFVAATRSGRHPTLPVRNDPIGPGTPPTRFPRESQAADCGAEQPNRRVIEYAAHERKAPSPWATFQSAIVDRCENSRPDFLPPNMAVSRTRCVVQTQQGRGEAMDRRTAFLLTR